MAKKLWGVIRYPKGGRNRPGTEFDGWYTQREDAEIMRIAWMGSTPTWNVVVVQQAE